MSFEEYLKKVHRSLMVAVATRVKLKNKIKKKQKFLDKFCKYQLFKQVLLKGGVVAQLVKAPS